MRFLHTADVHLGTLRRADIPYEAKLARYKGTLQFIFVTAQRQKVDYIIIAGDIFEHKDVKPRVRDLLLQAMLHYNDIPVIMIPGNHDELEEGYTSLRFLTLLQQKGKLSHLHFTEIAPKVVEFDDVWFVMTPYTGDDKGYGRHVKSLVNTIPKSSNKPIVVVGHEMVVGVDDDSGWHARHGVKLPKLKRVTYWAMGDIHKQQSLSGLPNAWYPGSPAQHKFSEAPNKGVLIVDTDDPCNPTHIANTHPAVKALVVVDSDDPEDMEDVPEAAWVSLKTSNVEAMKKAGANVIKSTPRSAKKDSGAKIKLETSDPLVGLPEWLNRRMDFSKEDAEKAAELARTLV